ncbi:hypothetical protein [Streptomyces sp. 3214.6]|uniref:hypothetical protein n=1 Tax=Streptomyces sp. 3214.6 TaxID=1882757 RepID=UPI00090C580F|nr:hypothetical protein [Streptomyces sp. 3214.6]SHH59205.1 hypothetical protein SAMN05444521_1044 [Streptomyces sp. 3214.6]
MTATKRTAPLKDLGHVPWPEIKDSTGSAADIPILLTAVARGDADSAESALGQLRRRICQFGFVVDEATAATVPFLWELVRLPQVTCRAEILRLLKSIADTRQWETTAAAYPKLLHHPDDYVGWERAARDAVHAQRDVLRQLLAEPDTEIVRATTELAETLTG